MEKETGVFKSSDIGKFALRMALTNTRAEEAKLKDRLLEEDVRAVAVDFGGNFLDIISKIVEHAVVAAQRQGVVKENHVGEGAVIGACREALQQIKMQALGMNVGGKIGIARYREHLCVAIYAGVGILNFNEMAVGLAHRSLP